MMNDVFQAAGNSMMDDIFEADDNNVMDYVFEADGNNMMDGCQSSCCRRPYSTGAKIENIVPFQSSGHFFGHRPCCVSKLSQFSSMANGCCSLNRLLLLRK